eukprot:m.82302 g.82302  ORF g.82302 m.82302 type:complete len:140 (+) comp8118_c0_seq2:226-645(+)
MAFAVYPRTDCPHVGQVGQVADMLDFERANPCKGCGNVGENWLCLACSQVFCSRYVHGHMAEHATSVQHALCMSMLDLSFWCYACDSYVTSPGLEYIARRSSQSVPPPVPAELASQVQAQAAAEAEAQAAAARAGYPPQ